MKQWECLEVAHTPQYQELTLWRRDTELVIRASGRDLMSNRMHGSEEAMAQMAASKRPGARVLVGGLGMGYTLRSALDALPKDGRVTVAELSEAVVEWNRGPLIGPLAGNPLQDPRTDLAVGDVGDLLGRTPNTWDSILLDVDNGPDAFTQPGNAALYGLRGLNRTRMALRKGGILAVWSAYEDDEFPRRMVKAGFEVRTERVRARLSAGGPRHVIYLGRWAV